MLYFFRDLCEIAEISIASKNMGSVPIFRQKSTLQRSLFFHKSYAKENKSA